MEYEGLTAQQALERLERDGPNSIESEKQRNLGQQLLAVVKEPMLILLLIAGGLSYVLGEPLEASLLMLTVLIVISISVVQTRRTERAVASLKALTAPRARAIRDSKEILLSSETLVAGDLILVREGDRVPADAQLISSTRLRVDESTLTGESFSTDKTPGSFLSSGTLVVKGSGRAKVTATGPRSQIGQIGALLRVPARRTPLQREIDQIVKVVAIVALAAAGAVTVIYGWTRGEWLEAALAGIAASMALLPEELTIVITVFLSIGAWRMARKNVLVRTSPAIETLGQISVLCVDKTGTLTMNEMKLVTDSKEVAVTGLLASSLDPFDPTDKAFHAAAEIPEGYAFLHEDEVAEAFLGVIQSWRTSSGSLRAAKGAPESILPLCELSEDQLNEIYSSVHDAARDGFRVLAVARQVLADAVSQADPNLKGFEFVGLAKLADPVRVGVKEAIAELDGAGVNTVMITGDYPETALAVARQIGINHQGKAVTGEMLDQLSDESLSQVVSESRIFARMRPHQKLRLVQAFQSRGEMVAMTGDGVNDSPALKAADIGISMGLRGSEVAREASDLVIADDSFLSIVNGVRDGRRIFSNLRKAAVYVIAVHIPIFALALTPIFSSTWPLVLLPIQIAMLELIIDPASSLGYESEEASPRQMKQNPRKASEKLISLSIATQAVLQGAVLFVGVFFIYIMAISQGFSDEEIRSQAFATLLLGNLFLMMGNRSSSTWLLKLIITKPNAVANFIFIGGLALFVFIFSFEPVRSALGFAEIALGQWPAIVLAAFTGVVWLEITKLFRNARRRREVVL